MKSEELKKLIEAVETEPELRKQTLSLLMKLLDLRDNLFHPLVFINGHPRIGKNVYIGAFSVINAKDADIFIGDNCDIASFVSINCADSHKKCIGLSADIDRNDIIIENNVFIGSHSVIKGGAKIGHYSVVGAATVVEAVEVPPYSLVVGNPMVVKSGYYTELLKKNL